MEENIKIVFKLNDGSVVNCDSRKGEILLNVARRAGVNIDAPCSGNGTCGKCKVQIESGTLKSERSKHITQEAFDEGFRLSCVSEVEGDATIIVPASALAYQNSIRVAEFAKDGIEKSFVSLKNMMEEYTPDQDQIYESVELTLSTPTLDDPMADNERVCQGLAGLLNIQEENIAISLSALRKIPELLRDNSFNIHCLIQRLGDGVMVMDVDAKAIPLVGVAIDIGTTSVSAMLVDLKTGEILKTGSAGNAQIRYGADVINRLIESTKKDGINRLRNAIVDDCLNPLIGRISSSANMSPDVICRATITANTTMIHLLLGIPGNNLRMEPYVPAFFKNNLINGMESKLNINPNASVIIAPNIGSYVGGDITAGALSSMIDKSESFSLLIDLGTNGEIVFGNSDFLMACACSAGPAFEGGEISCGMRATDGAIDSCKIDENTLEPTITLIGEDGQKPVGLCGSGIIDTIGELFRCGIINAKGKFIKEDKRIVKDEWGFTSYLIVSEDETETGDPIEINDADIDNFIRAKGSIFSAIVTMLNTMDMDTSIIENVYIAGGIGSGVDIESAIGIGMLPKLEPEQFSYIGNTSLAGSYAMLISSKAKDRVIEIADNMTYIELSVFPGYMDEFIAACFLPHTNSSLFE